MIGKREQEVLGRDVLVFEPLGLLLGLVERFAQRVAEVRLAAAADLRKPLDRRDERRSKRLDGRARVLEQGRRDAFVLVDQGVQQMLRLDGLVTVLPRQLGSFRRASWAFSVNRSSLTLSVFP